MTNLPASIFRFLKTQQWATSEEISEWQFERLRELLSHSVQHVPWYQQRFRNLDVAAIRTMSDLRQLPILTRQDIQQNAAAFRAIKLPNDLQAVGPSATSGSSGVPLEIYSTNKSQAWWLALCLRDIVWCGIDPRGTLLGLRKVPHGRENDPKLLAGIRMKNWGRGLEALTRTGPAYLMDVQQDPQLQLRFAQQVNPDYIISYPSNLLHIARLMGESQVRLPNLKIIQAIAEEMTIEDQSEISSAFGVPVKNVYTCEEAGYIASPSPDSDCLLVHEENVVFEVLDENDKPCEPGNIGRVILTPLHNAAMPLIRYDIGDYVERAESYSGQRQLQAVRQVIGKQRPLMILPNGKAKSSHVLAGLIRDVGHFRQFQLHQKAKDHVQLTIVPADDWNADRELQMRSALTNFFESQIEITINLASHLRPSPSGKLQSFLTDLA